MGEDTHTCVEGECFQAFRNGGYCVRINYKKLLRNSRDEKYGKLDELKPFEPWKELPIKQKLWLINYYKLRAVWTYLGYDVNDFPHLMNGPIIEPTPWMDPHHPLNRKLQETEDTIKQEYGPNWKHWKNYQVEYYWLDENLEIIQFEPSPVIVEDWVPCPECTCLDKCYQHGLCGTGCTNPLKRCDNNKEGGELIG